MALRITRALWGTALLLAPRRVLRSLESQSPVAEALTRVLGARQVAEAAILSRSPRPAPPRWTIAIDLVHAASMLALAVDSRRYRRDALASMTAASLFAGWGQLERRRRGG